MESGHSPEPKRPFRTFGSRERKSRELLRGRGIGIAALVFGGGEVHEVHKAGAIAHGIEERDGHGHRHTDVLEAEHESACPKVHVRTALNLVEDCSLAHGHPTSRVAGTDALVNMVVKTMLMAFMPGFFPAAKRASKSS